MKKRIFAIALALMMVLAIAVPAFAAGRPTPVVGGLTNGDYHYGYGYAVTDSNDADVVKMAYNGCLNGLLDGRGRYSPSSNITQWEFTRILANMYSSNAKFQIAPEWLSNDVVTQQWCTTVLTIVSKQLGKEVTWNNNGTPNAAVSRADACWFICRMVEVSGNYLTPPYWY